MSDIKRRPMPNRLANWMEFVLWLGPWQRRSSRTTDSSMRNCDRDNSIWRYCQALRGRPAKFAYLFRIDPFGNIHNLSAHESRRNSANNNNDDDDNNNDVVAGKEPHKFSRPTLKLEAWSFVANWDQDQLVRPPFEFICDRCAVISCRQIVALYLLRAALPAGLCPVSQLQQQLQLSAQLVTQKSLKSARYFMNSSWAVNRQSCDRLVPGLGAGLRLELAWNMHIKCNCEDPRLTLPHLSSPRLECKCKCKCKSKSQCGSTQSHPNPSRSWVIVNDLQLISVHNFSVRFHGRTLIDFILNANGSISPSVTYCQLIACELLTNCYSVGELYWLLCLFCRSGIVFQLSTGCYYRRHKEMI